MLKQNLYFAPQSVKTKAYLATVRPILEYGSSCWSPSSSKLIKQLEMVQHRAARFATNSYGRKDPQDPSKYFSITKLLSSLDWTSLEERRTQAQLTMAYKIINNMVILSPEQLPLKNTNRSSRHINAGLVGPEQQLQEPRARLCASQNTFFFKVPKLWNNNA